MKIAKEREKGRKEFMKSKEVKELLIRIHAEAMLMVGGRQNDCRLDRMAAEIRAGIDRIEREGIKD